VAWDIPLTEGYEFELVPNISRKPGTDSFWGLRNPSLVERVMGWRPDLVHITGWAWLSHLLALHAFHKRGVRTLFRGDSHLLDVNLCGFRWRAKHAFLQRIYSWPSGFLVVGTANRAYYEALGVESERLFPCPHSIDVGRFAEPADVYEREAAHWRQQLGIMPDQRVILFAGKFEHKKQPLVLMRAVQALANSRHVLILVGGGELEPEIRALAAANPKLICVLPFQNQSQMPVVYRLGDVFVLPSKSGETWGLAVNEALACGRPVLVSDRVGCAADVVDGSCGRVFPWNDLLALEKAINEMSRDQSKLREMRRAAAKQSWLFDISRTDAALMVAVREILGQ
jgi:glycosyltransferase involved in cell wall biosynthesis